MLKLMTWASTTRLLLIIPISLKGSPSPSQRGNATEAYCFAELVLG